MKGLQEIVQIVSKQKIKKIQVMGNATNESSKMQQLYKGIADGEITTDEEASMLLYQEKNSPVYKKLKYRLQNRLLNSIFFIDVNKPSFNDAQKAFYNCQRSLAAINILFGRSARTAAVDLAEKTIRKAIDFEFSEIVLSLSRRLSRHYGTLIGDLKKFKTYSDLTKKYAEIYNAEILAEEYFNILRVNFTKSGASHSELEVEAIRYSEELRNYVDKVNTNQFLLLAFLVFYTRYELVNDYENALAVCKEAVRRLEEKTYFQKNAVFLFYNRMIACYTQLKNYEEGEPAFKKAISLLNEGSSNRFVVFHTYMKLSFHSKKYQNAYDILCQVKHQRNFATTRKNIQEVWLINEAYVHFFMTLEMIDPQKSEYPPLKKFRLNKFLNEVPIFSMDKRGMNIPILIIQVLFLLQQKKYDHVIDKVEALNAYCYRYLKKDDTFRSNCFIKMLVLLPKCDFHKIAVERKSKVLLEKLKSVPLEMARQSAEIEIVPYEDLWEIVMSMLQEKFFRSRDY